ncbi:MAG: diguanylate cyclase [Tepidimonas taiwanensis]|nr:diguanylate cyclase [Tepidimonas taiwanensis]
MSWRRWLVAGLAWWSIACASAMPVLGLDAADAQGRPLGPAVELLEDPDGALSWERVSSDPGLPWRRSDMQVLNFSFSDSTWWARLRLDNPDDAAQERAIELAMPLHDDVLLTVRSSDGDVQQWRTGDRFPFASRPVPYRYPLFKVRVPARGHVELWWRFASHDGLYDALPLTLWTLPAFTDKGFRETLILGAYFGAIGILMLYMLAAGALNREASFAWYAAYLGSFLLWNYSFTGFGFATLWPSAPVFNNVIIGVSSVAIYLTLGRFTQVWLRTAALAPWADRWLRLLMVGIALHAVLDWYAATFRTLIPLGVLFLISLLAVAARLAWRGVIEARLYLIAWAFWVTGALVYYARVLGWLPSQPWVEYALNIGSMLEMVTLAMMLSWRIHELKSQARGAQEALLHEQRSHSARLESEVRERTRALQDANARLEEQAATDPLTSLANRRAFQTVADREWRRAVREGQPLALALLDLDHFKWVNDALGHPRGDEALRLVGGLLREWFRRGNEWCFRTGGEEFAVVAAVDDADRLTERLEAFRRTLDQQVSQWLERACREVGVALPDDAVGTVSIGVCVSAAADRTAPGGTDDWASLYRHADEALYAAKHAGRNRVIVTSPAV